MNTVKVRESKDGLFRWLLVDDGGGTMALGTGGYENAEEALAAGEEAFGLADIQERFAVRMTQVQEERDNACKRVQELHEHLGLADKRVEELGKEKARLKGLAAHETAKVNRYQREVVQKDQRILDLESDRLFWFLGVGVAGAVFGMLCMWAFS